MASKKERIEERTWQLLEGCAGEHSCIPVDVEYVKNNGEYLLNIYIDKEGGVGIDDCESVSRSIESLIDEENYIEDQYTLIVSSPGLGREIRRPRDFVYAKGKEVDVHTFKKINGEKSFRGILRDYDDENIELLVGERSLVLDRKAISVIKIAFDF